MSALEWFSLEKGRLKKVQVLNTYIGLFERGGEQSLLGDTQGKK